jgi:hypothetical protein
VEISKETGEYAAQVHRELRQFCVDKLEEMRDRGLASSRARALALLSAALLVTDSELEVLAMKDCDLLEADEIDEHSSKLCRLLENVGSQYGFDLQAIKAN